MISKNSLPPPESWTFDIKLPLCSKITMDTRLGIKSRDCCAWSSWYRDTADAAANIPLAPPPIIPISAEWWNESSRRACNMSRAEIECMYVISVLASIGHKPKLLTHFGKHPILGFVKERRKVVVFWQSDATRIQKYNKGRIMFMKKIQGRSSIVWCFFDGQSPTSICFYACPIWFVL